MTTVTTARPRARRSAPVNSSALAEIDDPSSLAALFKIDNWDALVVGDGSGMTMASACGWGSVLIEADDKVVRTMCGGLSNGTNNMAELLAVLQPLLDLTSRKRGVKPGGMHVHVFSDSEYVINGMCRGSDLLQASTSLANRELWLALYGVRRNGMVLTAHHVPRDTLYLQQRCHDMANASRLAFAALTKG